MGFEGSRQESQPQPGPSRPPPSSLPVPPVFPEKDVLRTNNDRESSHPGSDRQVTDKNCPVYCDSENLLFNLGRAERRLFCFSTFFSQMVAFLTYVIQQGKTRSQS